MSSCYWSEAATEIAEYLVNEIWIGIIWVCNIVGRSTITEMIETQQPRPHENGGAYGKGVIVQSYRPDSDMEIGVELTANHRGYFEFRLCPLNQQKTPETDECFDRHLLTRSDGQGARFHPEPGTGTVSRVRYKVRSFRDAFANHRRFQRQFTLISSASRRFFYISSFGLVPLQLQHGF